MTIKAQHMNTSEKNVVIDNPGLVKRYYWMWSLTSDTIPDRAECMQSTGM